MGRAVAAILDHRTNLKSSDELIKDALILGQTSIDLARVSVSFLTRFRDRFAQCVEQTAIPSLKFGPKVVIVRLIWTKHFSKICDNKVELEFTFLFSYHRLVRTWDIHW